MRAPRFFLDSCNPQDTQLAVQLLGSVDGQTTNPTLLLKNPHIQSYVSQGKKLTKEELYAAYAESVQAIAAYTKGPISVEVYADWSSTADQMLEQAYRMQEWHKQVYIKFPTIPQGLEAAKRYCASGRGMNLTLVFEQKQAAAVYSATMHTSVEAFVSPFVGRWDDRGFFGLDVIKHIRKMYDAFNVQRHTPTSHVAILAASLRTPAHIAGSLAYGADIVTAPYSAYKLWKEQPVNPMTFDAIALTHIPSLDLSFSPDFESYSFDTNTGSLLHEGMIRFAADWNSIVSQ